MRDIAARAAVAATANRRERGAALIIVIAIMTILLAIALTFFTTANFEVNNATNVANTVRVDYLQDAATAIAISTLNQDFLRNPQATSPDHPWRSLPSGAAFAGKPWARFKGLALAENVIDGIRNPGLPEFNFTAIERRVGTLYVVFDDGITEPLFQGSRTKEWLFVPRYQGPTQATGGLSPLVLYDCVGLKTDILQEELTLAEIDTLNSQLQPEGLTLRFYGGPETEACLLDRYGDQVLDFIVTDAEVPFVTSPLYGRVEVDNAPVFASLPQYPAEQVGDYADVDNDGDGQNDSIWLPIPGDLYFPQDGLDNNLNGWVDEQQDDGVNNDGNFEGGDMAFGDSLPYTEVNAGAQQLFNDADEAIEPGVFVYFGGDDGLDNDGDGLVDAADPDEDGSGPNQGLFLTAPLPGLSFYVDLNADGVAYDLVPAENDAYTQTFDAALSRGESAAAARALALEASLEPLRIVLPAQINVRVGNSFVTLGPANVDTIDNDYDLVVNDYAAYCYLGPNTLTDEFRPPFETYFNDNGIFANTATNDVYNSYLSVYNDPANIATQLWSPVLPPPGYYNLWRSPGNWFQPVPTADTIFRIGDSGQNATPYTTFAAAKNVVGDPVLFDTARRRAFTEINTAAFDLNGDDFPDFTFSPRFVWLYGQNELDNAKAPYDLNTVRPLLNAVHITHSGEPACELVGRAAIHIADAASQANLNVIATHTYNDEAAQPLDAAAPGDALFPATRGDEAGPYAFEPRMLPQVSNTRAFDLWAGRTGAPFDAGVTNNGDIYHFDAALPGYGRADDNADALLLALNGKDDDGDGLIDEGLFLPRLSPLAQDALYGDSPGLTYSQIQGGAEYEELQIEITRYLDYFNRLGNLEGIDDPAEFQVTSALRNLVAERDGRDNNSNGQIDEPGELADRVYADLDPEEILARTGVPRPVINRPYYTTFSTDRSANFITTAAGAVRALNRIDYNFATPQQTAAALLIKGGFEPSTTATQFAGNTEYTVLGKEVSDDINGAPVNTNGFAKGLLAAGLHRRLLDPTVGAPNLVNSPTRRGENLTGGALFARINEDITDPSGPIDTDEFVPTTTGPSHEVPADPFLDALKLAATLRDNTDRDHARAYLTTESVDLSANATEAARVDNWPPAGALNAREAASAAQLLPTEEIEDYINASLGLDPKDLQLTDTWWAALVNGIDGQDEQRHLAYTVPGHEAIVINEIMARPVRRLEAEMVSVGAAPEPNGTILESGIQTSVGYFNDNPLDPMDDLLILADDYDARNFDPAPLVDLDGNGEFDDPLPSFNMSRQTLFEVVDSTSQFNLDSTIFNDLAPIDLVPFSYLRDSTYLPLGVDTVEATWYPDVVSQTVPLPYTVGNEGNPGLEAKFQRIGEGTALSTIAPATQEFERQSDGAIIQLPDVVQFIIRGSEVNPDDPFASPDGLPAGHYYLTVNTTAPDGTVTVYDVDQLDYSIKYVPTNEIGVDRAAALGPNIQGDRTILGDIFNEAAVTASQPAFDAWLAARFFTVPAKHIAGPLGSPTYGEGRAPGWAFLDGTPGPPPAWGYFLDGEPSVVPDALLPGRFVTEVSGSAPPLGEFTNTVYVPGANSGVALCIAVKRNPFFQAVGVDPRISINFFDFQQQPDHEYVEIANTSDKEVDLTGWKLEIGIPTAEDLDDEPHLSRWTVPSGTTIAPGGTLLLGFDVFDTFQLPVGDALKRAGAIANNGMGLAAGLAFTEVTEPPIRDISYLLGGDPYFGEMFDPDGRFHDPTGSVFRREPDARFGGETFDYVDRDGDGLSSGHFVRQGSTLFNALTGGILTEQALYAVDALADDARKDNGDVIISGGIQSGTLSNPALGNDPAQPWDRIIQLECEVLRKDNAVPGNPFEPMYPVASGVISSDLIQLAQLSTVDAIADLVLRGGILPDYPEHDGHDNDGDGSYFVEDRNCGDNSTDPSFPFKLVRGTLDKDMIDNDLNGLIDEHGAGNDDDLDGCYSDLVSGNPGDAPDDYPDTRLSEGVDEGRLFSTVDQPSLDGARYNTGSRQYGPGSFEAGILPAVFFDERAAYPTDEQFRTADPASYALPLAVAPGLRAISAAFDNSVAGADTGPADDERITYLGGLLESYLLSPGTNFREAYYLGCDLDPPDWKAFAERRWNPGDNVIVSLYAPAKDQERYPNGVVADRATYREYDVINRTIDDVALTPYFVDVDGDNILDDNEQTLNLVPRGVNFAPVDAVGAIPFPGYPTYWAPNHMGLDFYRALERKDPQWHGDLFGTSNRWQPTDGAYDDWAEALPFFRAQVVTNPDNLGGVNPVLPLTTSVAPLFLDPDAFPGFAQDYARLYRHCIYGSPLRMNLASRLLRNPADLPHLFLDVATGDSIPAGYTVDDFLGAIANHGTRQSTRPFGQFAIYSIQDFTRYLNTPYAEAPANKDWNLDKAPGVDRFTHRDALDDDGNFLAGEALAAGSANENAGRRGTDEPLRSGADLMRLPSLAFRHDQFNTAYAVMTGAYSGVPRRFGLNPLTDEYNIQFRRFPVELAGGVLGRDDTSDTTGAYFTEAVELMPSANDNIVLTVGQANFVPIAPARFEMDNNPQHAYPTGTNDYFEMINWQDGPAVDLAIPPAAWAPIYLFELPDDDEVSGALVPPRRDALPFYPAYPNGAIADTLVENHFLFSSDYLFPDGAASPSYLTGRPRGAGSGGVTPGSLDYKALDAARRLPFSRRVAMYVSANRDGQQGLGLSDPVDDRPDAVFTWDTEDGLENGEYVVYIGTFLPGLRERINAADGDIRAASDVGSPAASDGQHISDDGVVLSTNFAGGNNTIEDPAIASLLALEDPSRVGGTLHHWNPRLQIELITDRTSAQGVAREDTVSAQPRPLHEQPGLLPPSQWDPGLVYTANDDGYIFYGSQEEGAWQPITVRVTDGFLALRVRNAGQTNQVAAISHIVLTPRKRVPGKININTAQFAQYSVSGPEYLFSTLLGLPGAYNDLVDIASLSAAQADDQITAPTASVADGSPWLAPEPTGADPGYINAAIPPRPFDPQFPDDDTDPDNYAADGIDPEDFLRTRATQVAALIQAGRTVHPLGRYYESIADLVRDDKAFNYRRDRGNVTVPDVPDNPGSSQDDNVNHYPLYPLSNQNLDDEARFEDNVRRFRRLANAITVRSDVFEIIATVQAGYGIDADGDGRFNYRSPDEFVTTAESTGRVVYERRAPSDVSDTPGSN